MLSIQENLKTKEAAEEYNQKIYKWRCEASVKGIHPGCVGALACTNCYHVISDSVCLCIGVFDCPNCGTKNGRALTLETTSPVMGQLVWMPINYPDIDYSI